MTMQTIDDTLSLMRRQAELESAMRHAGGIRVTEEMELHTIRRQLEGFPEAVDVIVQAARALRKSITDLNGTEVEAWSQHERVA
jgi:hypothetical protein